MAASKRRAKDAQKNRLVWLFNDVPRYTQPEFVHGPINCDGSCSVSPGPKYIDAAMVIAANTAQPKIQPELPLETNFDVIECVP